MTATDEDAMRRHIAERARAWIEPAPTTNPITPCTSSDKASPPLTHQRYLENTYAVERAK